MSAGLLLELGRVFIVTDVWDTPGHHQERLMEQRLGPAPQESGVPAPTRVLRVDVLGHHQPS